MEKETPFDLTAHMRAVEKDIILQALNAANFVKAEAARRLGINRTTLVEKLRILGMGGFIHAPHTRKKKS